MDYLIYFGLVSVNLLCFYVCLRTILFDEEKFLIILITGFGYVVTMNEIREWGDRVFDTSGPYYYIMIILLFFLYVLLYTFLRRKEKRAEKDGKGKNL